MDSPTIYAEKNFCDKDKDNNVIDSITSNPILDNQIISIRSGHNVHCFDIDTLYRIYVESNGKPPLNPFTRQLLSDDIIKKIIEYERNNRITIGLKFSNTTFPLWLPYYKSIGDLLIKLLKLLETRTGNIITAFEYDFFVANYSYYIYQLDMEKSAEQLNYKIVMPKKFSNNQQKQVSLEKLYIYLENKQDNFNNRHIYMLLNHYFNANVTVEFFYKSNNKKTRFWIDAHIFNQSFDQLLYTIYDILLEDGYKLIDILCQIPKIKRSIDNQFVEIINLDQIPIPINKIVTIKLHTGENMNNIKPLKNWLFLAKSDSFWEPDASFLLENILNSNEKDFDDMNTYLDFITSRF